MSQQTTKARKNNEAAASTLNKSEPLKGRSMPESLEAEAAVLGSMILDRECIGLVVQILQTDSFYRSEHQMIFDALVILYEQNSEVDLVLLRNELKKRDQRLTVDKVKAACIKGVEINALSMIRMC